MAPTMHRDTSPASYTPESDVTDRHEYGVCKSRKQASAGSGRAWSDDEEVYLLQTRLQKMPYKHIAAHLKKTELACRLHYHQLSHGSNRRRRTTSVSSASSSVGGRSPPLMHAAIPSPIREHASTPTPSLASSSSPDSADRGHSSSGGGGSAYGYNGGNAGGVRLPSIHGDGHGGSDGSPRLPAILPKPASMMMLALATGPSAAAVAAVEGGSSEAAAGMPLLPAATFTAMRTPAGSASPMQTRMSPAAAPCSSSGTPSLRLDCRVLPRIQSLPAAVVGAGAASVDPRARVDWGRLQAAYGAHRAAFWAAVAAEYGYGAEPAVLEQAWWMSGGGGGSGGAQSSGRPLTPATPPDDEGAFYHVKEGGVLPLPATAQDKTRIASILGIDANPRSPKERELVRRLEEERGGVPLVV